MKRKGEPAQKLRGDVAEALARLWPDGMVELNVDYEDSWFLKLQPKVARAFKRLKGAHMLFERAAEGDPSSRSYQLYFIVPDGAAFEFTTETEDYIDGSLETAHGDGRTGWCVAISLLAPFAVIMLSERIAQDDGVIMEPALELFLETFNGEPIDPEEHFREMVAEEAFSQLTVVRHKIAEALERYGVTVLPREEWKKRAPALRLGEGVSAQEPLRVLDALFFEL
jgi:hypothetical protein